MWAVHLGRCFLHGSDESRGSWYMAYGSSWSQESALMESSLGRGEMGSSLQCEDWFSSVQQTKWNLVFSTFWASPLNPPGQSTTGSKQKLEVEGLSIFPLLGVWFCGGYESYANLFVQEIPLYFFLIILSLSRCPHPSSWRNLIPIIALLSPPLSLTGPRRLRYSEPSQASSSWGTIELSWGGRLPKGLRLHRTPGTSLHGCRKFSSLSPSLLSKVPPRHLHLSVVWLLPKTV